MISATHAHHGRLAHHDHHDSIAGLLDLDARVLRPHLDDVMSWVHAQATGRPVRRILDVGAGTGTGTVALADRYADAEVVAVDRSADMLDRVRVRAVADGLTERVSTVQLDLDEPWPDLGSFDLVWASAALHELTDPDRAFENAWRVLNPGGLLVVVELTGPPRFLEDEVGDGLELRIQDALRADAAGRADHPDWTVNIERAGFTSVTNTTFPVDISVEADGDGGRYAQVYLRRVQQAVAPRLSESDRATLERLVADTGSSSIRRRGDLRVRTGRRAWAARRP